jgi:tetratricopeptide (TPR) repeat protein
LSSLPPAFRRLLPVVLAGLLAFWLGGCADNERLAYASELDEPNYREGQSLLKSGRRQEALTAFLKVVDKRRDDAPESHLEAGLLYAQHINDPLSAIYHFRKYLAIRPNSPQAPLVRQRIDAAIREFARTIPARPIEDQTQRVDLIATLDRLKQENDSLKQQLADVRAARGNVPVSLEPGGAPAVTVLPAPPDGDAFAFSLDPLPTVRTRPAPRSTPPVVATPPRAATPVTPPAAAAAGRTHVIQPGDTLYKLAQQYYGNRSRWREIYSANLGVMRSESDLKVGMQLKIP